MILALLGSTFTRTVSPIDVGLLPFDAFA